MFLLLGKEEGSLDTSGNTKVIKRRYLLTIRRSHSSSTLLNNQRTGIIKDFISHVLVVISKNVIQNNNYIYGNQSLKFSY